MSGGFRIARPEDLPAAFQEQAKRQLESAAGVSESFKRKYEVARAAATPTPPAPAKPRRNKYGAERVKVDGIWFDSKREAKHFEKLKRLRAAGEVKNFWRQVIFDLEGGIIYKLDFLVVLADGSIDYRDVKGRETEGFKLKRKLVRARYGIEISLV